MAKRKQKQKTELISVYFLRSIAGPTFSYKKGQKDEIDAEWAKQLEAGGTVRILGSRETSVGKPPETATAEPAEDATISPETAEE